MGTLGFEPRSAANFTESYCHRRQTQPSNAGGHYTSQDVLILLKQVIYTMSPQELIKEVALLSFCSKSRNK